MSSAEKLAKPPPSLAPRARIPYGAWPRGLGGKQAAAYVGVGESKFRTEVKAGIWPEPDVRGGRRIWDRELLDRAYDRRSRLDREPGEQEALQAIHDYRRPQIRHQET